MLPHLIISIAFGLIAALYGAMMGAGFGTVLLWYLAGGWVGFLLSILVILVLRPREDPRATVNVRRTAS